MVTTDAVTNLSAITEQLTGLAQSSEDLEIFLKGLLKIIAQQKNSRQKIASLLTMFAIGDTPHLIQESIECLAQPFRQKFLTNAQARMKSQNQRNQVPLELNEQERENLEELKEVLKNLRQKQAGISPNASPSHGTDMAYDLAMLTQTVEHMIQSAEILSGGYNFKEGRDWQTEIAKYEFECKTAEQAVAGIETNSKICLNSNATGPIVTAKALVKRVNDELVDSKKTLDQKVKGLELSHFAVTSALLSCGACTPSDELLKQANLTVEEYQAYLRHIPFFRTRHCSRKNPTDVVYNPLYQQALAIENGEYKFNTAIIQIPPPVNGIINLGFDVGVTIAMIKGMLKTGGRIIFEVNPALPYMPGPEINLKELRQNNLKVCFVQGRSDLKATPNGDSKKVKQAESGTLENEKQLETSKTDQINQKIVENLATLIQSGDTVQMGIGAIPTLLMESLKKNGIDVNIHSEVLADGICAYFDDSTEQGRTNIECFIQKGRKITVGIVVGSQKLINFMAKYPQLFYVDATVNVNNPTKIAKIDNMKAINMGLTVTIGGQVTAFTVNGRPLSGPGGQSNFAEGANASYGRMLEEGKESRSGSIVTVKSTLQEYVLCNKDENGNPIMPNNNNLHAVPNGWDSNNLYFWPKQTPVKDEAGHYWAKFLVSKIATGVQNEGVTQTLGQVRHVATEWGTSKDLLNTEGLNQRIAETIKLAHPVFRLRLLKEARNQSYLTNLNPNQDFQYIIDILDSLDGISEDITDEMKTSLINDLSNFQAEITSFNLEISKKDILNSTLENKIKNLGGFEV